LRIRVRRLDHAKELPLLKAASEFSSGSDLRAAVLEPLTLVPGDYRLVPTGLQLEIPVGWEGQVRPRSGLALRHGITVLNSPGTIDSDYRGEVGVILINHGRASFTVKRGDRIAQLVVVRVETTCWEEVADLSQSHRGDGGFGSTGVE